MRASDAPVMPLFAFKRQPHIEAEGDFELAGEIMADIADLPQDRQREVINKIIGALLNAAEADCLSSDMLGFDKPPSPRTRPSRAAMAAWERRAFHVGFMVGEDGAHVFVLREGEREAAGTA